MMLMHAPSSHPIPFPLMEVSALFCHIRSGLQELDALARRAKVMEDELHQFLLSYYARILPLTARLERLRYRKQHGLFPKQVLAIDTTAKKTPNLLVQKQKSLFRSLAKRCHPDHRNAVNSITIEEVYAAKSLSELWLLEIRSACDVLDSDAAMNRYLAEQCATIAGLLTDARHYTENLQANDMWLLKERVYDASLRGVDMIDHIQIRIENQIAALQQYFVRPAHIRVAA